jgi:hypothetical protein
MIGMHSPIDTLELRVNFGQLAIDDTVHVSGATSVSEQLQSKAPDKNVVDSLRLEMTGEDGCGLLEAGDVGRTWFGRLGKVAGLVLLCWHVEGIW